MLHILLLILKIIGILLGILVGTLLLGICLALFVPVRYQIAALRTEGEGNPPVEATVKVTWLLHFLNVRLQYPAEIYLRVRLLCFPVFCLPRRKKAKNAKKAKQGRKKGGSAENGRTEDEAEGSQGKSVGTPGEFTAKENRPETKTSTGMGEVDRSSETKTSTGMGEVDRSSETKTSTGMGEVDRLSETETSAGMGEAYRPSETGTSAEPERIVRAAEHTGTKEKRKVSRRLQAFFLKIRQFFQNIWYTIAGICDKIRTIAENIEYYWNVLQSDTFRSSFFLCRKELAGIWKTVRPRKLQADLMIGTGDPASTGQLLSYYGILYPFIGQHVTVVGDFEQKRIEGFVYIKGKIRMFTLLKAGLHIFFSKDIRALLKLFKKEEQ